MLSGVILVILLRRDDNNLRLTLVTFKVVNQISDLSG